MTVDPKPLTMNPPDDRQHGLHVRREGDRRRHDLVRLVPPHALGLLVGGRDGHDLLGLGHLAWGGGEEGGSGSYRVTL